MKHYTHSPLALVSLIAMLGVALLLPLSQVSAASINPLTGEGSPDVFVYTDDLVRCPDFSAVYLIAGDGTRRAFPNEQTYFSRYENFEKVKTIPCTQLASYRLGKLVKYQAGTRLLKVPSIPTVYAVGENNTLRAIASETQAKRLYGDDWATRVDDMSEAFFVNYTVGEPLEEKEIPIGLMIADAAGQLYRTDVGGEMLNVTDTLTDDEKQVHRRFAMPLEVMRTRLGNDIRISTAQKIVEDFLRLLDEYRAERGDYDNDNIIRPDSDSTTNTPTITSLPTITVPPSTNVIKNIPYKTIAGVDPQLLSLDIYPTSNTNAPIMIGVHGGSWQRGDKGPGWAEYKPDYFTKNGFMFVSVNYRLSPSNTTYATNRIKYPIHPEDVASAIAWISKNAAKYGGDAKHISLIGHSAGGGIVSLLSTDQHFLRRAGVAFTNLKCSIVLDSDAWDVTKHIDQTTSSEQNTSIYYNAFATPRENAVNEVWSIASPINHVSNGISLPDFFIVTRGQSERIKSSVAFRDLVKASGNNAQGIVSSYSHEMVNTAVGHPDDKEITPALTAFLPNCRSNISDTNTGTETNTSTSNVTIETDNTYRHITSTGIADHTTGTFPNLNNPNTISAQNYKFRMLLNPIRQTNTLTWYEMNYFGVALNGVPFDPTAAEWWKNDRNSGWNYDPHSSAINLGLDSNNAHVQPNGAYHYHGIPTGMLVTYLAANHSPLIGYAADGFPIYVHDAYANPDDATSAVTSLTTSYRLKQGSRGIGNPAGDYNGTFIEDYGYDAATGDLDECNGRVNVTPEYPNGIYTYYLTDTFPYIPRCLVGTPDPSFSKGGSSNTTPPPSGGGSSY